MHHQASCLGNLHYCRESGAEERGPLFGNRHVELIIREATLAKEMVAHQKDTSRLQNFPDLGM